MNSSKPSRTGLTSAQELRSRLPLPELMNRLGFAESNKHSARCPFHEDQHPSFSVFETSSGHRWKCHAQCGGGDEVDFLRKVSRGTTADAFNLWREMAGAASMTPHTQKRSAPSPRRMILPQDFHPGSEQEHLQVADLRGVSRHAVYEAVIRKVLGFGTVFNLPCWIVTDPSLLCAEARRLDGQMFPAVHGLGVRKVHTLRGSSKSWPVGLGIEDEANCTKVLLLEGSGDLLAGYHFARDPFVWLPVAILGASIRRLHPDALHILSSKRVRVMPHADSAGHQALEFICRQLEREGCTSIEWIDIGGWRTADGSPIKDLNDCVGLHPEHQLQLRGLLK
jgi:hypothetical protein